MKILENLDHSCSCDLNGEGISPLCGNNIFVYFYKMHKMSKRRNMSYFRNTCVLIGS